MTNENGKEYGGEIVMDSAPIQMNGPASAGRNSGVQAVEHGRHNKKKFSFKRFFSTLVIALVIIAITIGGLFLYQSTTGSAIDNTKYQAVHLVSGMNYYGKLHNLNNDYMKLTEVYYLQLKSDVAKDKTTQTVEDVELIKWGNEIQGPVDEMIINKDQIVSFENLKHDGKVAQAIEKYKKQ